MTQEAWFYAPQEQDNSLAQNVQIESWVHTASYSMGMGFFSSGLKRTGRESNQRAT
jgi:hypothetical protein